MNSVGAWPGQPEYRPDWLPGSSFRAAITSEYLGVGYIIGPKVAGILFAGGVFSWLVLMPAIKFFGSLAPNAALYPSTIPIPQMTPDQLWSSYIRPMGAGAVAAAGLITLIKTLPTIISALKAGLKDVRAESAAAAGEARTDRDLPIRFVLIGSLVIVVLMWAMLTFVPVPGAKTGRVFEFARGDHRGDFRIFVCDGGVANQRVDRKQFESDQRNDDCDFDGYLRGVSDRGMEAAAVCGARADDRRRGVYRVRDCRRHFAGFENGIFGRSDAEISADRIDDRSIWFRHLQWACTLIVMNKGLEKYNPVEIPLNIEQLPAGVESGNAELRARRENLCAGERDRRDHNPGRKISVRSRGAEN